MTRRCSHCSSNGHNTRSCSARTAAGGGGGGGGGLRLFGVRLVDGSFIKKSASMGNLSHYSATADSPEGYHSDDPDRGFDAGRRSLRKKGIPWTEEEHRQFLLGLQKLGKGDWRGISKNYVPSRTPTQVASHAQKYFIRQTNATRKKKRTSLFDMVPNLEMNSSTPEQSSIPSPTCGIENEKLMLSSSSQEADTNSRQPSLDLSLKPSFTPLPFELWPPNAHSMTYNGAGAATQNHVLSKVPAVQEQPVKELLGLSQLNLSETYPTQMECSPLSLRQPGMP